MPLTVGDGSTCYQTYRKNHDEVGRNKSVAVNPCRTSNEMFSRFNTNAIGDPFKDPGSFNKSLRSSSPKLFSPFKTQGNKTVRKSEFNYIESDEPKGSHALRTFTGRFGGFYNRKTAEPFTTLNKIGYTEEPYERKEDLQREEYSRLNSKILF